MLLALLILCAAAFVWCVRDSIRHDRERRARFALARNTRDAAHVFVRDDDGEEWKAGAA